MFFFKKNKPTPPIYLRLIFDILQFEISSLMDWIFAGYTGSKTQVETGGKNQVQQTRIFKLEIVKKQVQIIRRTGMSYLKSMK